MVMSVDPSQGVHVGFTWKNQPRDDLTNLDHIDKSNKQNINMKLMKHDIGIKEGVVPMKRKRSRGGVVIRSENNIINDERKDGKYRDSDHEIHRWAEKEKRMKMRSLFASLHALLPELPSKADKSTIVDVAVKKIKNLQQILEQLEKKKQEKFKYVSPFRSEPLFVVNSQWNPYESRETIIFDQGSSNYNNKFPINAIGASNPSNALSLFTHPPKQLTFKTWSSQNVVLNVCGGEAQFCICATKKLGLFTMIAFVLEKHMIDVVSANIMCNENGKYYMILAHAKQGSHDTNSMGETYKIAAREIMMWIA